jgi:hypothetical protein
MAKPTLPNIFLGSTNPTIYRHLLKSKMFCSAHPPHLDIGNWTLDIGHLILLLHTSHNSTAFASDANLSGAVGMNSWAT